MNDDLLETIARAICEADAELPEALDPLDISGKGRQMWRRYVPHALAALEAMHVTTPAFTHPIDEIDAAIERLRSESPDAPDEQIVGLVVRSISGAIPNVVRERLAASGKSL